MKRCLACFLIVVFALAASGCATATIKSVATAKETFVVCRAVDVSSTIGLLSIGGKEMNPILAPLLKVGYGPFIMVELLITIGIMHLWDDLNPPQKALLNGISCAPAVWNSGVAASVGVGGH